MAFWIFFFIFPENRLCHFVQMSIVSFGGSWHEISKWVLMRSTSVRHFWWVSTTCVCGEIRKNIVLVEKSIWFGCCVHSILCQGSGKPKLRILDRFQTPQNANKSVQQVCALNPILTQPTNFHESMMSKKSQTVKSSQTDNVRAPFKCNIMVVKRL